MNSSPQPPRFMLRFFRWFCHRDLVAPIEGDLHELYQQRVQARGKGHANRRFMIDVLLLFRPSMMRPFQPFYFINPYSMFRNYFTVSIRNILKYKVFSFINVFGLAVAMSVCMLIILMLGDRSQYDAFHEKKDRIYRVLSNYKNSRQSYATTAFPLASTFKAEYPVAEETVNLTPGFGGDAVYQQRTADMRGYFADGALFRVFDFELIQGDKKTALTQPYSVIISRALAQQLFQNENALGKTFDFSDRQLSFPLRHDGTGSPAVAWGTFTVTGVIDESNYKSHLVFDALISASTQTALIAEKKMEDQSNNWEGFYRTYTYVLLHPDHTRDELDAALQDLAIRKYKNFTSETTKDFKLLTQSLPEVQLDLKGNDTDNRLPRIGYFFLGGLAIMIMVLACVNYTNLSTARALTRAKEIGVRKVTGATRRALLTQFLSESILTSLLALVMAGVMLIFIANAFKGLWVNQFLNFELPMTPGVYVAFVCFALVVGIIAGAYPALKLSTYQPIQALRNSGNAGHGKLGLRKVLSVSQFVVSLLFITTSLLIYQQFKHYLAFDYGFASHNIVNVELQGADYEKVSHVFGTVQGVSTISATDIIPATNRNDNCQLRKVNATGDYFSVGLLQTDENFADNLELKLLAGKKLPAGTSSARFILVNEAFVKQMGYATPADIVGEAFESAWGKELWEVVGVVRDFRFKLLLNADVVEPLAMRNTANYHYANIKIISPDVMGTVAKLEQKWKTIDNVHAFHYEFFDDQLAGMQAGIFDLVSILGFIAFLAVTIACLGLLGMATYSAERRTKEVGIRKTMGAGDKSIALLLSKEFMKIVLLSIFIGAPLSYFANNLWLQTLPNRVEFGLGILVSAILILIALGMLTIGSQTWRAARAKPVDALKME
ncbi:FtsX-like permease family protein [Chryseolinea lacunae]|uniref:ABC transporter permease n=1 Tax=Chryseolinea lacunae TaxID=2801331 RepID=A0ABS1KR55_9BACT|nr:FtsX-like permease family protein [Chryseolinea lacunae]MBL0741963.1 ABC transporter permease [Chryseolinea lacunae]